MIATLKHFAAHGQPESGNNCAPVNISERVLRETFLYSFQEALDEGGAISVMASYNEIDGVPSHASRWLLRDVLRKEWGFKGFVVSDYYAIRELAERPELYGHHVARDGKEACLLAVRAGVNIELPEPDCYLHLVELVEEGTLAGGGARRAGRADAGRTSSSWGCSTIRTSIRRWRRSSSAATSIASSRSRRRARRSRC